MKRITLALLAACVAGVGSATVVFSDGFETGDFSKWTADGTGTLPTIVTDRVRSGGFAAFRNAPVTTPPTTFSRYFANFDPLGQPIVRLSAWVFDPGWTIAGRQFLELRAIGAGGSLDGLWAIGVHNTLATGVGADATRLQARVLNVGPHVWFNLTSPRLTTATAAWRHFQIEVTPTHSRFLVDGELGAEVARGGVGPVNRLFLNTGFSSDANPVWIDDVTVEAVPEPASLVVLGAGALALLRRRRKR